MYYILITITPTKRFLAELINTYDNNRVDYAIGKTEDEAIEKLKNGYYGKYIDNFTNIIRRI